MTAQLSQWFEMLLPLLAAFPRALALVITVPLFPKQGFTLLVRNGLALSMLVGVYPMLVVQMPATDLSVLQWFGIATKEAFVGFIMGYAIGSVFWVFQSVGDLIDNQIGLNNASIFDPFGGHSGGPYAAFLLQLCVVIFVAVGGLHVLFGLLYESYTLWPVQSFVPQLGAGYARLAQEGLQYKGALTLTLVAPLVIVLVLAELAVGLVNRVAPQLNSFYFAMPIKGVLALLLLVAMISPWVEAIRNAVADLRGLLLPWNAVWR